jgi:hypothetical protein
MKRTDANRSLPVACHWACWVLEHTDMPKQKVFRRASQRFGIPAAAIERAVVTILGEVYLSARANRMVEKYHARYAANNSRPSRICRDFDKHFRDI